LPGCNSVSCAISLQGLLHEGVEPIPAASHVTPVFFVSSETKCNRRPDRYAFFW